MHMQCISNSWHVKILVVMVVKLNKSLKFTECIMSLHPYQAAQAHHQLSSLSTEYTPPLTCLWHCLRRPHSIAPNIHGERSSPQAAGDLNISNYTVLNTFNSHGSRIWLFAVLSDTLNFLSRVNSMLTKIQSKTWMCFRMSDTSKTLQTWSLNHRHLHCCSWKHTTTSAPRWANYIAGPCERDTQSVLEIHLQHNHYNPFVMHEEYIYIQCGIQKRVMKRNYENLLKEANTALCFPSFINWNGVQKLRAITPDDQAHWEWEVHTLEDMRWNDNHQPCIKFWSWDIIKSISWWMRQPAYAGHHIYAPQKCFNSDTPPKHLYSKTHTADWWLEKQVRRETRG